MANSDQIAKGLARAVLGGLSFAYDPISPPEPEHFSVCERQDKITLCGAYEYAGVNQRRVPIGKHRSV